MKMSDDVFNKYLYFTSQFVLITMKVIQLIVFLFLILCWQRKVCMILEKTMYLCTYTNSICNQKPKSKLKI